MSKKILTLTEQRHIWSTLSETFVGLTQQEKYDIIKALGLDGLVGEDGSYIPFYSMDIHSSRPTYITNQFDTKLTANLYNYTEDVSSDVTEWKWERISGNKEEDERWAVGKNTRELDLTHIDFTERFTVEQDITFKVSATIKGKTVTDEIIFSKILYFSKVQIVTDKNVFIESTPEKIRLSFTTNITIDSIRWYIDNKFLSASETFGLGYNLIPLGGSATIKLEVVEEVTGKVFTDSLTIPRISNGTDGGTPYTLNLSNDNVSIPANSSGTTGSTAFDLAKTDITLYYGNDITDPSEYTLSFIPTNVTYVLSNNNHHLQITGMTGSTGEVKIEARANNKLLTTTTFSVVKVVGTAIYEILPSTSVIKIVDNYTGGDQEVQPTSIRIKIKKNSGESVDTVNEGILTYRYIYTSSAGTDDDGVNIPIDQVLKIDNSGNPLFLEFKYFHPVTNVMVDRETIPFVRDGVSANTTELRFRVTNTSTIIPSLDKSNPNPPDWTVTQPTVPSGYVLWMTRAVKKANGDLIGQWSDPIIFIGLPGAPGNDGPQGPPGISGTIGPSPRTFEWLPGAQYQVGEGFIDYTYYRGTGVGDPCLGWYVVKLDSGKTIADYNTTAKKVIANATGYPDPNLFVRAPFSGDMTFSTIIAEQANLAGFLFRNQVLYSQSITSNFNRCTQITKTVPNLILDGFQGIINFADRMILKSDGVYLYDSCERVRLKIRWDESTGVPIIEYVGPNGETTWTPDPSEINTYVEVRAVKVSSLNAVSEGVILPELQPFLCKKSLDSGLPVISTPLPLIGYGYYGSRTPDVFDVYQGMNSLGPKLDSSYDGDYIISLRISNYNGGGTVKVSVKYAKIVNGVLTVQRILLPTYYTISDVQNNC